METSEAKALRQDVENVRQAIFDAIPTEVKIVAVIIALAELQKEMALLFFEEEEEPT